MPKRKAKDADENDVVAPRRSTRHRAAALEIKPTAAPAKKSAPSRSEAGSAKKLSKAQAKKAAKPEVKTEKPEAKTEKPSLADDISKVPPKKAKTVKSECKDDGISSGSEKQYWLLKAEPETRLENGVDVRFSIDDLAAKTEPEPWDGIRSYAARNNLRAMKKGDLAFFYHSNCKEPGIVGTMEIVQEHSPDLSAHDPKAPYYDASSKPSDPKWSVVHVKFRSKFDAPITLKELREMAGSGKPLENMQMLKQTRLSVSKVGPTEWAYLIGIAEGRAAK